MSGLSTGIKGLDELLGAIEPGSLMVIAGGCAAGKTALALQIAEHQAKDGTRVAFHSAQMSRDELAMRTMARGSGVSATKMRNGEADDRDMAAIRQFTAEHSTSKLAICDSSHGGRPEAAIESAKRFAADGGPVAATYFDSADCFLRRALSMAAAADLATRQFGGLAKDLGCFVAVTANLRRGATTMPAGIPAFDLANAVIVIDRDMRSPDATLILAKNRNGRTGEIRCTFDGPTTTFREVTEAAA